VQLEISADPPQAKACDYSLDSIIRCVYQHSPPDTNFAAMPQSVLALDIGGANLKAAHSQGIVRSQPFALWKNPNGLNEALRGLTAMLPPFAVLAVTMTGELCDCFDTKRQGVHAILDAVQGLGSDIRVWQTDGRLVGVEEARSRPLRTAAANWLALATYAGRFAPSGAGLLIDIGSTTTDIIPLLNGIPIPQGRTDPDRLRSRELVYTGVRRTPICALLGSEGAAELFATTHDVYLMRGDLAEDPADRNTADGRPATRLAARARLARMRCADAETCSDADIEGIVHDVAQRQLDLVGAALRTVSAHLPGSLQTVILAGAGEFLATQALIQEPLTSDLRIVSFAEQLGHAVSEAACAYALMVLTMERLDE
jgi:probable H4MPT-linked C1 transfer pathway protein